MAVEKQHRVSQVARKLNVGISTIMDTLREKGFEVDNNPNTKIPHNQYIMLLQEFESSLLDKEEAANIVIGSKVNTNVVIDANSQNSQRSDDLFVPEPAASKPVAKQEPAKKTAPAPVQPKTQTEPVAKVEEPVVPKKEETKEGRDKEGRDKYCR